MPKEKDIIITTRNGLYAMTRKNGSLGFTNKESATHFPSKSNVKRTHPMLEHYNIRFIDLNNKPRKRRRRNGKKEEAQKASTVL